MDCSTFGMSENLREEIGEEKYNKLINDLSTLFEDGVKIVKKKNNIIQFFGHLK